MHKPSNPWALFVWLERCTLEKGCKYFLGWHFHGAEWLFFLLHLWFLQYPLVGAFELFFSVHHMAWFQLSWYEARKESWVGCSSSCMVSSCVTPHHDNQTHFLAGKQPQVGINGRWWVEMEEMKKKMKWLKRKQKKERKWSCHETKVKNREGWLRAKNKRNESLGWSC